MSAHLGKMKAVPKHLSS